MQQPGSRRKSWTAGRFGEPRDPLRPAHPHLLVENQPSEFPRAVQLASPAGKHDPAAGHFVEAARLQPIAHQLEGLLDARRDDADEQGFGYMVDVLLLLADLRDGDHLTL